jgi:hypothetical protein
MDKHSVRLVTILRRSPCKNDRMKIHKAIEMVVMELSTTTTVVVTILLLLSSNCDNKQHCPDI